MKVTWERRSTGWCLLRIDRWAASEAFIYAVGEIPGATVTVLRTYGLLADVTFELHRSTLAAPIVQALLQSLGVDATDVAPAVQLPSVLRPLRPYQVEAAEWLVAQGGGLLGDAMGLGKTTSAAVAAAVFARREGAPVLIIGPRYVRDVWRRELQTLGLLTSDTDFVAVLGERPDAVQEYALGLAGWWFCHAGLLDGWRAALTRPLYAQRPCVAIVDEAHWFRNPKATRTKAAVALVTLTKRRIILTGTPLVNHLGDLWPLLTMAQGPGSWGTAFGFLSRYTNYARGDHGYVSSGLRNMDEYQARLSGAYLRRTLADVGNQIPSLTRESVILPAMETLPAEVSRWGGGDLSKALDRLENAFLASALGEDTLKVLTAWRKATSKVKLPETAALVSSLLLEGEKVLVFCWTRETTELLERETKKQMKGEGTATVFRVTGEAPQDARDSMVAQFQSTDGPAVIFATYEALKEGVTLHAARRVILHDLEWVPATVLQAEARIHRLGQQRACISTWMRVERSADDLIAKHLVRKGATIELAMQDSAAKAAFDSVGMSSEQALLGSAYATRFLDHEGES